MADHTTTQEKPQRTTIFNKIFLSLILSSLLLVLAGVGVWMVNKQARVGEPRREAMVQAKLGGAEDTQCDQLEYRYKHFRTLKRRHIATIYYLNGDRQVYQPYFICLMNINV